MTIEVRPFGVRCNIACAYCYQNPIRDAGNALTRYDIDRIKGALERDGGEFTLFGGEPLMMPIEDLESLWSWGYQKFGRNGVQTNGVLINSRHVELFKKYDVRVGISVDGPGDLNNARRAGTLRGTRRATAKTHAAIELLGREGVLPSIIVTLHKANATADKLAAMNEWFQHLDAI